VIPVCEFCADSWFAMTFSAPMETFYGETARLFCSFACLYLSSA
jgi:hypothetical protein